MLSTKTGKIEIVKFYVLDLSQLDNFFLNFQNSKKLYSSVCDVLATKIVKDNKMYQIDKYDQNRVLTEEFAKFVERRIVALLQNRKLIEDHLVSDGGVIILKGSAVQKDTFWAKLGQLANDYDNSQVDPSWSDSRDENDPDAHELYRQLYSLQVRTMDELLGNATAFIVHLIRQSLCYTLGKDYNHPQWGLIFRNNVATLLQQRVQVSSIEQFGVSQFVESFIATRRLGTNCDANAPYSPEEYMALLSVMPEKFEEVMLEVELEQEESL